MRAGYTSNKRACCERGASREAPAAERKDRCEIEARGRNTRVLYIIAIGLLIVLFSVSIWLSVSDPQGTIDEYHKLSFPDWLLIPQASAKLLGLIGVVQRRSRTIKDFAYAGFLYNLLLAFGAHVATRDPQVLLALLGLAIWVFAFAMDRLYQRKPRPGVAAL